MIGRRIKTLRALIRLASERRSVVRKVFVRGKGFVAHSKPQAAAVAVNWPAMLVQRAIDTGLYLYIKPKDAPARGKRKTQ